MKRLLVLMCIISALLSFVSCGCNNNRMNDKEVESKSKDFLEIVVNAISNYDEKVFNSLFTDEALSSTDFEKGRKYLLEIFEGDVLEVKRIGVVCGGEYSKYGKSYLPTISCDIITNKNEYSLYIDYYLDGYNSETGTHYSNKINRLRLAVKSDLPETGGFARNGGMGSLEGIYHPDIILDD